ncbi:phage tail spike protein [Ruminococcus sp.]|uniref:phage tail spike protein n=1 Tax=Ruminococcus sp. TaxID=41978 RepID=UPI001B58AC97|nr:phage tail spike protein [Ruminococcus sp.]MBP5431058.1 phage tail protein [Ruminococcus sp.]
MYRITINGQLLHEPDTQSRYRLSSGRIDDEVNQIPKFTFRLPVLNPRYEDELNDRKDIIEVTNTLTNEVEFEGTLLTHTDSMTSAGKLTKGGVCEGYLGYLCDSIQPYHTYENNTVTEFLTALLAVHNANVSQDKQISLGLCNISGDNTNSKTTAYRNTLEEIKVNLIERIGGEIRIRKVNGSLVLDFMDKIGSLSTTKIQLADNIKELSVDTDSTNIITRLIPLGYQLHPEETAERLTIASVNSDCIYLDDSNAIAQFGIIEGTVIFDDITVAANLKTAGQNYLTNNNRIRKAYEAQVLDLSTIDSAYQPVKCGNTYPFENELIGIDEDLRVMRRTVDIYKPYAPTIEIGDRAERITDIATRTAQLIEYELPKQKLDILASAKSTATELINAGINGHVVVNGNEILIMDTDDKTTATHVWRYNLGGWGVSHNGYAGPYTMAATLNGGFVADFITAGVLRGLEIVNGNNTFHVHTDGTVDAAALNITGGSMHVLTNNSNYSVIDLRYSGQRSYQNSISPSGISVTDNTNQTVNTAAQIFSDIIRTLNSPDQTDPTFSVVASTGAVTTKSTVSAQGNISSQAAISAAGNITSQSAISAAGNISSQATISGDTLHGDTLQFEWNGNTYNVGTLISTLWNEVFGGGM